jgi:hypothetical protein
MQYASLPASLLQQKIIDQARLANINSHGEQRV